MVRLTKYEYERFLLRSNSFKLYKIEFKAKKSFKI